MMQRIIQIIELRPWTGWIAAGVPAGSGLINLLTHVQVILGVLSLLIGIAIGVTTYQIQREVLRTKRAELRRVEEASTDG